MEGARRLADQVRTGLENAEQQAECGATCGAARKDPLLESYFGRPIKQHVKEFAAILATVAFAVAAVKLYKGVAPAAFAVWVVAGVSVVTIGYLAPRLLLPVWRGWMKLAHVLSIVMTCVILGLVWAIGFVPMAALLKVMRIKTVDLSYRAPVETYWEKRDSKYDDFKRLEQQF